MSELTKHQKFKVERLNRSKINEAPYNPRIIDSDNEKNLKRILKNHGLVEPLIWNKKTGNLVSGHMRLKQIDSMEKKDDYLIDISVIDVSEEEEIKLNLILNNTSLMGEYDKDKLLELSNTFPEIDFIKDAGFTKHDLEFFELPVNETEKKEQDYAKRTDQFEDYKKNYDDHMKKVIEDEKINGNSVEHPERNDKCLTLVFENNLQKWEFMKLIERKEKDKFIKYEDFTDIIRDDYRV